MNFLSPSIGLLGKIATILQALDESQLEAIPGFKPLLADRDVTAWLDAMHKADLINVETVNTIAHGADAQSGGAR